MHYRASCDCRTAFLLKYPASWRDSIKEPINAFLILCISRDTASWKIHLSLKPTSNSHAHWICCPVVKNILEFRFNTVSLCSHNSWKQSIAIVTWHLARCFVYSVTFDKCLVTIRHMCTNAACYSHGKSIRGNAGLSRWVEQLLTRALSSAPTRLLKSVRRGIRGNALTPRFFVLSLKTSNTNVHMGHGETVVYSILVYYWLSHWHKYKWICENLPIMSANSHNPKFFSKNSSN